MFSLIKLLPNTITVFITNLDRYIFFSYIEKVLHRKHFFRQRICNEMVNWLPYVKGNPKVEIVGTVGEKNTRTMSRSKSQLFWIFLQSLEHRIALNKCAMLFCRSLEYFFSRTRQ